MGHQGPGRAARRPYSHDGQGRPVGPGVPWNELPRGRQDDRTRRREDAGTSGGWHHDGRGLLRPGEDPVRIRVLVTNMFGSLPAAWPAGCASESLAPLPVSSCGPFFLDTSGLSSLSFSRECGHAGAVNSALEYFLANASAPVRSMFDDCTILSTCVGNS